MLPDKIIIQDKNKDNSNALRSLLSQAGYSVITIKTLKSLNSLIIKFKPNLLIIECDKDHIEAKKILSDIKKNFNIKVIATSCNGDRSPLINNIGFDDCLTRPYEIEHLHQMIRKHLIS